MTCRRAAVESGRVSPANGVFVLRGPWRPTYHGRDPCAIYFTRRKNGLIDAAYERDSDLPDCIDTVKRIAWIKKVQVMGGWARPDTLRQSHNQEA